ncbi:cutinase [Mariannaea sp. PMI_226]|nr:cutinase [Mariannaea sp. PMI_226]
MASFRFVYSITLLLLGFLLVLVVGAGNMASSACAKGAHIIIARESQAPPGPGLMGTVAQNIIQYIPGSDIECLDYPALLTPYVASETAGVLIMTRVIRDYAIKCPMTRMVLLGYSQGAQVTSDVLCGGSEKGFPTTDPLPRNITDKIAAVVLMGDPSFTDGQRFNIGTSYGSGIFPRSNPGGCECIGTRMMSICDSGDMFCEKGGTSLEVHLSYVANWGKVATAFVLAKYHTFQH